MKKLLTLSAAILASSLAQAADLSTIYHQAASNDTQIAAARAIREANAYNIGAARGGLLPRASLTYSVTEIDSESSVFFPRVAPKPTSMLITLKTNCRFRPARHCLI